jgi:hypothetical protein
MASEKTVLGNTLSKVQRRTEIKYAEQSGVKYGRIKEFYVESGAYEVKVEIINNQFEIERTTTILPLEGTLRELALQGSPDDLTGAWVRVEFDGTSSNKGRAFLVTQPPQFRYLNTGDESVGQMNEIAIQGCAFAPPGASKV